MVQNFRLWWLWSKQTDFHPLTCYPQTSYSSKSYLLITLTFTHVHYLPFCYWATAEQSWLLQRTHCMPNVALRFTHFLITRQHMCEAVVSMLLILSMTLWICRDNLYYNRYLECVRWENIWESFVKKFHCTPSLHGFKIISSDRLRWLKIQLSSLNMCLHIYLTFNLGWFRRCV